MKLHDIFDDVICAANRELNAQVRTNVLADANRQMLARAPNGGIVAPLRRSMDEITK